MVSQIDPSAFILQDVTTTLMAALTIVSAAPTLSRLSLRRSLVARCHTLRRTTRLAENFRWIIPDLAALINDAVRLSLTHRRDGRPIFPCGEFNLFNQSASSQVMGWSAERALNHSTRNLPCNTDTLTTSNANT